MQFPDVSDYRGSVPYSVTTPFYHISCISVIEHHRRLFLGLSLPFNMDFDGDHDCKSGIISLAVGCE